MAYALAWISNTNAVSSMTSTYRHPRFLLIAVAAVLTLAGVIPMKSQPIRRSNELLFRENRGQIVDAKGEARPDILYSAEARGVGIFLQRAGFSYVFSSPVTARASDTRERRTLFTDSSVARSLAYRMDLQFVGANPSAVVTADDPSGTFGNYYLPHCRDGITGVPAWRRIIYHDIYPEIDLVLQCFGSRMMYDFIVRPGGRVSDIRLRYNGADSLLAGDRGSLVASNPLGFVSEESPRTYQVHHAGGNSAANFSGDTTIISSGFDYRGSEVRFRVDRYDSLATLVIDPKLDWATYVGGSDQDGWYPMKSGNSWGQAPVIDNAGYIVMGGITSSVNFPVTSGAVQPGNAGGASDFYIIKLDSVGRLIWGTYLGGGDQDILYGICGDYHGNIGVTGSTRSNDFPVKGAYQSTPGGALNMVIASLDGDGKMRWSTYYGGAGEAGSGGIAADRGGTFYVAGTAAADFPLIAGTRPQFLDPINIAMISVTNSGTPTRALLYGRASRYLGPSSFAVVVSGVAVDNFANVSITGSVGGLAGDSSFAVSPNAFQTIHAGASTISPNGDIFVIQFDSVFKRRWATLYGGRALDVATCVAVTSLGDVVIAGTTNGDDLPTSPDGFQRLFTGTDMAFVVKFDRNGKRLWGTMYGGGASNRFNSIVFGLGGTISVVGHTTSTDFPITLDAYQLQKPTTSRFASVIVTFDSNGARTWSSYYVGVGNNTYGTGVAVDSLGRLYAAGLTTDNLPGTDILPVFQPRFGGTEDEFIVRFGPVCPPPPVISVNRPSRLCVGDSLVLTASEPLSPATTYRWLPTGETTRSITFHAAPGISSLDLRVIASNPGGCADTSLPVRITINPPPVVRILPAGPLRICNGDSVLVSANSGGLVAWRWSDGETTASIWADSAGTYTVDATDTNGCRARTSVVISLLRPPVIAQSDTLALCPGDTLTLDAGPGYSSYFWEDGSTGQTHRVHNSGKYFVIVGGGGLCRIADSVQVVFGSTLTPKIAPSGPTLLCAGDSVTLDAGAAYASYHWSTNDSTRSITVRQPGTYHVTVTAAGGCSGTSADILVAVHPPLVVTITPSGPLVIPPGDSLTLDAGAGYAGYQWFTGEITRTITIRSPGDYHVTVSDSNGCRATASAHATSTTLGRATLSIGQLTASPGERLMVPVRLRGTTNITAGRSFSAELRYHASLLLPVGATATGAISGSDRVVPFSGTVPSDVNGGEVARLEFMAGLGDVVSTPLTIERIVWAGDSVVTRTDTGLFTLRGLCVTGGTRLINASGSVGLKAVRPNPAGWSVAIEYEVVESGRTRLAISDMLGRESAVLVDGEIAPGRYVVDADLRDLSIGGYWLTLTTPTQRQIDALRIVR